MQPEMRPSPSAVDLVVSNTHDFSFAFLKELTLSTMVEWAAQAGRTPMDALLPGRVDRLRPQLRKEAPAPSLAGVVNIGPDDGEEEEEEE